MFDTSHDSLATLKLDAMPPLQRRLSALPAMGTARQPSGSGVRPVLGVVDGSGVGAEVVPAALRVLTAVEQVMDLALELRQCGPVAEFRYDDPLPEPFVRFCTGIFASGGAMLCGPLGGRYVYEFRRRFDLFCKFVPVRTWPELADTGRLRPDYIQGLDLLLVRDNAAGVYQGRWSRRSTPEGEIAEHSFSYSEPQVRRIMEVAARAAAARQGRLHVIIKDGGVPAISDLWRDIGQAVGQRYGIDAIAMNVDRAVYELLQHPAQFDVIATPNMCGDIMVDVAGVLVGSRGLTFSGNYSGNGSAAYQTNHGSAHDLAGTDSANPAGQILSLAMLLRESFRLDDAAMLMEESLAQAWRAGFRTADVAAPGCQVVGTQAMADRVVEQVHRLAPMRRMA